MYNMRGKDKDRDLLAPRARRTRRGPKPRLGRSHVTTYTPSNPSGLDERPVGGVSLHLVSPPMSGLVRHGHLSLSHIARCFSSGPAKDVFSDTGAADILVTVAKAGNLPQLRRLPEVSSRFDWPYTLPSQHITGDCNRSNILHCCSYAVLTMLQGARM